MDVSSSEVLPLRLYSAKQVRAIDQSIMAQEAISAFDLMMRTAQAALKVLLNHYPATKQLCVLAGSGNNGGDAWLLAALALKQGLRLTFIAWPSRACAVKKVRQHGPMPWRLG